MAYADLFRKCSEYTLAKDLREKGIYAYFHALESRQDVEVMMEGKRRIMLGSNNYLGLTVHPEIIQAGKDALEKYGTGCSGSRFLNGTLQMHLELERELASFLRKEAVMTFSTAFSPIWESYPPLWGMEITCSATKKTMPAYTTDAS